MTTTHALVAAIGGVGLQGDLWVTKELTVPPPPKKKVEFVSSGDSDASVLVLPDLQHFDPGLLPVRPRET